MNFNESQRQVLNLLDIGIEEGQYRMGLSEGDIQSLCEAFGGDPLWSLHGVGFTRIVITHPEKNGYVLKIAFTLDGVQGNRDEYTDYHAAPDDVKAFLGTPGELLADGKLLEMVYYKAFTEDHELTDYQEELDRILNRIRFVNYQDPPYCHSFGVDVHGAIALIDYGETEKFEIMPQATSDIQSLIEQHLILVDVATDLNLHAHVDTEQTITYRFVEPTEQAQDEPVTTKLRLAYDDIEDLYDWSFQTPFGSRYFLHQFDHNPNTHLANTGGHQS